MILSWNSFQALEQNTEVDHPGSCVVMLPLTQLQEGKTGMFWLLSCCGGLTHLYGTELHSKSWHRKRNKVLSWALEETSKTFWLSSSEMGKIYIWLTVLYKKGDKALPCAFLRQGTKGGKGKVRELQFWFGIQCQPKIVGPWLKRPCKKPKRGMKTRMNKVEAQMVRQYWEGPIQNLTTHNCLGRYSTNYNSSCI